MTRGGEKNKKMSDNHAIHRNLTESVRKAKNAKIASTLKATKERRANSVCRVFDLKISKSHISREQKEALKRVFLEAKWLRNDALANGIFDYEIGKTADVLVGDHHETRELNHLGSQMKQSVVKQLKQDVYDLSKAKKKGCHVGQLKFKRFVNSIELKQYGTTYRFKNEKMTRIKIQRIPGTFRVSGASQIPSDAEIANARLVRRPDGYHVLVTVFLSRDSEYVTRQDEFEPGTVVGVDMGLKTSLTLSDGSLVNVHVGVSDRVRRLQRKLARQVKGSNGYERTRARLRREYGRASRVKDDVAAKVTRDLLRNEIVYFQDENLSAWKSRSGFVRGGRKVQDSILGRVKARLERSSRAVELPSSVPTTQFCPVCGSRTRHGVSERVFVCASCGFSADRDVNAACNMVRFGQGYRSFSPVGCRFVLVEGVASADGAVLGAACASHGYIDAICKQSSLKQEAPRL